MRINFYTEDISFRLRNKKSLRTWIKEIIIRNDSVCGEISFIFLDDAQIRKMNKDYLQHDYATDVITFNYNEDNVINGDIFIGLETVILNSKNYNVRFQDELHRVMIHGVLHLLGWEDSTPELKAKMHTEENEALSLLQKN